MTKPHWYRSVAVWVTILTLIAAVCTMLSKTLTVDHVGVILATAAGVAYALQALFEADGSEFTSPVRSATFWIFVASAVIVVLQALPGHWAQQAGTQAAGILALIVTYLSSLGVVKGKAARYQLHQARIAGLEPMRSTATAIANEMKKQNRARLD